MTVDLLLSNGMWAKVSDEDAHLCQYMWTAQPAGKRFYASRHVAKSERNGGPERITLHRQVMDVADPAIQVDHLNGDGLDCRRENLRLCNGQDNLRNRDPGRYPGVRRKGNRWLAHLNKDYRQIFLGSFMTREEALAARRAGEVEHWGYVPFRRQPGEPTMSILTQGLRASGLGAVLTAIEALEGKAKAAAAHPTPSTAAAVVTATAAVTSAAASSSIVASPTIGLLTLAENLQATALSALSKTMGPAAVVLEPEANALLTEFETWVTSKVKAKL